MAAKLRTKRRLMCGIFCDCDKWVIKGTIVSAVCINWQVHFALMPGKYDAMKV